MKDPTLVKSQLLALIIAQKMLLLHCVKKSCKQIEESLNKNNNIHVLVWSLGEVILENYSVLPSLLARQRQITSILNVML